MNSLLTSSFLACRWFLVLVTMTVYLSLITWHALAMEGKCNCCCGYSGVYTVTKSGTAADTDSVRARPTRRSLWQRFTGCFHSKRDVPVTGVIPEAPADDVMPLEDESSRWDERSRARHEGVRKRVYVTSDLLGHIHSLQPGAQKLIKQLLKKPVIAARVFALLEDADVRTFLEKFPELPPPVQKQLFAKYKDKCPQEYRITTLKGASRIELVADFPRSANKVFSEQNVHYLPHLLTNVVLFTATALLSGYEEAYAPGFLYEGARAMVREDNLFAACNALARGDKFNINAPLTGSLFQRLQFESGSFDRSLAISASIALIPTVVRPALMPFVTFGWLLGARALLNITNRIRQPDDVETLTRLAKTVQAFGHGNEIALLEQLQKEDIQAGLVCMTENPEDTLKLIGVITELDQPTRLELLHGLLTLDSLNVCEPDTRSGCSKLVHRYLNIDHSRGKHPWSTNIPTALYQLLFRRDSWYIALGVGLTVALLVHGSAVGGLGYVAPYISSLGGKATIIPPATLNMTCASYVNGTEVLVGDLLSINTSPEGTVSIFVLSLLTDVVLNGIYKGCQAVCVGAVVGVKKIFCSIRHSLERTHDDGHEAGEALLPPRDISKDPSSGAETREVKTTEV